MAAVVFGIIPLAIVDTRKLALRPAQRVSYPALQLALCFFEKEL